MLLNSLYSSFVLSFSIFTILSANPKLGKFPALKNVSIDSAAIELSPEEKAILKAQVTPKYYYTVFTNVVHQIFSFM